jgi:hypothetical protein
VVFSSIELLSYLVTIFMYLKKCVFYSICFFLIQIYIMIKKQVPKCLFVYKKSCNDCAEFLYKYSSTTLHAMVDWWNGGESVSII